MRQSLGANDQSAQHAGTSKSPSLGECDPPCTSLSHPCPASSLRSSFGGGQVILLTAGSCNAQGFKINDSEQKLFSGVGGGLHRFLPKS